MSYITETSDPDNPIQYYGKVLGSGHSALQDWVVLRTEKDGDCLFIDNQLQSSTLDETLYHEMMVHSVLCGVASPKRVLVLGGAEGCMVREILRWPKVERIVQVDWDGSLVEWFQTEGKAWNGGAYEDPRVCTITEDALTFLRFSDPETYNAVFIDLLDPHTEDDLKFLQDTLRAAKRVLVPGGALCINAGLVKEGAETPACGLATFMKSEFKEPAFHRCAFKVNIPSYFGEWGFLMATGRSWSSTVFDTKLPKGLKHFQRSAFLEGMKWDGQYPDALTSYWRTERSWASVATNPVSK